MWLERTHKVFQTFERSLDFVLVTLKVQWIFSRKETGLICREPMELAKWMWDMGKIEELKIATMFLAQTLCKIISLTELERIRPIVGFL